MAALSTYKLQKRGIMIRYCYLKNVCIIIMGLLVLWIVPTSAWAKMKVFEIATGEYMGRYYPTGGAIAKIVNNREEEFEFRCIAKPTPGSMYNINAIMAGNMAFGIVQSDSQYNAFNGSDKWKNKGPQKDLRSIFSLYTESITLLASVDSGVRTIKDLKGKRVSIGRIGSGSHHNAIDALNASGIDWKTDIKLIKIEKNTDAHSMLIRGDLDAFFYTVGHPTTAITFATGGVKKSLFIPIANIEELLSKKPYYVKSFIPVSHYPLAANDEDVKTFGVKATFVTSSKIPDRVVYAITKAVFENLGSLKFSHPTFNMLTKESMVKDGLTAPIHPGALIYYKEAGLK
jgi:TRAP transporter TAXI family solute receptor